MTLEPVSWLLCQCDVERRAARAVLCVEYHFTLNSFEFQSSYRSVLMDHFKLIVVAVAVSIYAAGCSQTPTQNVANATNTSNRVTTGTPAQTTPAAAEPVKEVNDAKEIYALNCMICHK